jgi:hypothetical protein
LIAFEEAHANGDGAVAIREQQGAKLSRPDDGGERRERRADERHENGPDGDPGVEDRVLCHLLADRGHRRLKGFL